MREGHQTVVVIGRAHHSGFLCKEKEKRPWKCVDCVYAMHALMAHSCASFDG